jgi:hypothetical protein
LPNATPQARILQAILQNTLEQTVLAVAAYLIWAVVMPHRWLWSIAIAALLFVAEKSTFHSWVHAGRGRRAMGFGLTAYPTFGMLVTVAVVLEFRLLVK